jgi:hypothetical protein
MLKSRLIVFFQNKNEAAIAAASYRPIRKKQSDYGGKDVLASRALCKPRENVPDYIATHHILIIPFHFQLQPVSHPSVQDGIG